MRAISLTVVLGVAIAGARLASAGDGVGGGTTEVDGTWRLAGYIEDGRPNEEEVKADYQIVRTRGSQEITRGGKFFNKRSFKVDPRKAPKHIDFIDDKGAVVRGVYEFRGNELRMAILADPERQRTDRPGDLKEPGNIVAIYERVPERRLDAPGEDNTPRTPRGRG